MANPPIRVTEEQIAAAQLRLVLDEKLGRQTPEVVGWIAAMASAGSAVPQTDLPRAVPEAAESAPRQRTSQDQAMLHADLPRAVPEAVVGRLAVYLRVLTSMIEQGVTTMSSEELAGAAGVNPVTLRKDLSYVGSYGTRGVGYNAARLVEHIERLLGLTRHQSVAIVGMGHLGHALANYGGFPGRGFPVTALFDIDEDLIGIPVGGVPVDHVDNIPAVCVEREVTIGVICTPAAAAQLVCDLLVAGGVRRILTFAPEVLQVPDDVEVRRVDLAVELQILSFYEARRVSRDQALPAVVTVLRPWLEAARSG